MIRLEFYAIEDGTTLVGEGDTFLKAAAALLEELTVFEEMELDFWPALTAVSRHETQYTSSSISSPETNFVLRRIDNDGHSAAGRAFEDLGHRLSHDERNLNKE